MTDTPPQPDHQRCDVLVVGAGPAGAAAAHSAAQAGWDVLLTDMQSFPRDKTCGDGLTPRAVGALQSMGAGHLLDEASSPVIQGLKLHGFGGSVAAPWPKHESFPARGAAIARTSLDNSLVELAVASGARLLTGVKAVDTEHDLVAGSRRVRSVRFRSSGRASSRTARTARAARAAEKATADTTVECRYLVLAEGVRSGLAKGLGTQWHRGLVHGIAARSYCATPFADEPWIHSHLELRDTEGTAQPGYGWIFPLGGGDGESDGNPGNVNLGCGALSTEKRPAKVNVKKLLTAYAGQCREEWQLGEPQDVASALLPMGGAVSRVAGVNWAAIGDTAALVNPLNGEGIDYALESASDLVAMLDDARFSPEGLTHMWPAHLREHYGDAFSLARRLAMLLTMPGLLSAIGPVGLRGPLAPAVMGSAARLMGNLVTPDDRDLTARLWLGAGRLSNGVDRIFRQDARPLFG
ncbi:MAG TPA: geranylgeranyl reductase family protein [Candidatus Corynebacterium avicola]|uniref:Geranylgeranyl reductase family protein n=1 Tax=Candidatus Corynebacterium avicola TaxID=2838527 RepID=A0A9D1RQJ9_9CORY|nr:geranylgeranyl reductase family protein [Candidatus Corynebacterium avicola]